MSKKWSGTLAALALSVAGTALAEVRVSVDSEGAVKALSVKANRSRDLIWTRFTQAPEEQLLNPHGDALGDGYPVSSVLALPADDPMNIRRISRSFLRNDRSAAPTCRNLVTPVVVWSHLENGSRKLQYSLWDYRATSWRPLAPLDVRVSDGSDLEPTIVVHGKRVYVIWRRDLPTQPILYTYGELDGSVGSYDVKWQTPREVVIDGRATDTPLDLKDVLHGLVGSRSGVPSVEDLPMPDGV